MAESFKVFLVLILLLMLIVFGIVSIVYRQVVYGKSPFDGNVARTIKIAGFTNDNLIVMNTGNTEVRTDSILVYMDNIKVLCRQWSSKVIEAGGSASCVLFAHCFSGSHVKVAGPENIDTAECA